MNKTLIFLSLSSMSKSPQIMVPFHKETTFLLIQNSILSKYSSSFLQMYTNNHVTKVKGTIFKHFVSTPLKFASDCNIGPNQTYQNKPLKGINFSSSTFAAGNRPYFTSCGDILIAGCQFVDLESWGEGGSNGGGGLSVVQYSKVVLYECLFSSCRSDDCGAAVLICNTKSGNSVTCLISLDSKFCCFSKCYFYKTGKYGAAMYVGAKTANFSYMSTTDCMSSSKTSDGAQFDINAENEIYSTNINTTKGVSI